MDEFSIVCADGGAQLYKVRTLEARCNMLGLLLGFQQGSSREVVLAQAVIRTWLAKRHVRLMKAELQLEDQFNSIREATKKWKIYCKHAVAAKTIGRAFRTYRRRWSVATRSDMVRRIIKLQTKCNVQANVINAQRKNGNVIKRQSRGSLKTNADQHTDRRGSRY